MPHTIEGFHMHSLHDGLTTVTTIVRATNPEFAKRNDEPIVFSGEHNTARNTLDISGWCLSERDMRSANRFYRSRDARTVRDSNAWESYINQPHHGLIGNGFFGPRKAAVSSGYRKPKAAPRKEASNESSFFCGPVLSDWDEGNPAPIIITEPGEWDDPGAMWDDSGYDHSDPATWEYEGDSDPWHDWYWDGYVDPRWWDAESSAHDYEDQRHGWNIHDGSPARTDFRV